MSARHDAVRAGLGVGLAVGVSGLAFGAAAVTAGLSVAQACALSLFAFTGASQFALAGVVAGGGALVPGVAGALLLGARNGLYGLRLASVLPARLRVLTAHGVIDETSAVAFAHPGAARAGFYTTFAALYVTWNLTTFLAAVGASAVADPSVFGLDAVGPATFLALLWPRLKESPEDRKVALAGVVIALGATPFLPPGVPVLLAAAGALAVLVR
ncbi:AzlC family ABC transporter permease [Herbidospora sp. NBRC 101105]|uniref:AzlC family ABC transporter permease n=1 Tax=Herbidospora sp. NBRC 101105 TaxID=3032195 RepID=UPI0024A0B5CB|nr:AzlC family ABC transporter permease [Herbidospora sp. NBRC 101105]GLX92752.1 branched-chain amino acid ABC transporter permease [Herbidospora sp. NBRC 101105]